MHRPPAPAQAHTVRQSAAPGATQVFGVELSRLLAQENTDVPHILQQTAAHLRSQGHRVRGIVAGWRCG